MVGPASRRSGRPRDRRDAGPTQQPSCNRPPVQPILPQTCVMTELPEFVKEFLVDCREGLDRLDNDLVALENQPQDAERLASVFRTLHTLKGNAGFLDFSRLGAIAHAGETLLERLRSGK